MKPTLHLSILSLFALSTAAQAYDTSSVVDPYNQSGTKSVQVSGEAKTDCDKKLQTFIDLLNRTNKIIVLKATCVLDVTQTYVGTVAFY